MRIRSLALAGVLLFAASAAQAQGFLGLGADSENPSLKLPPAEIAIDVPMPVNSANLALLLAQAGEGGNLSSLKDAALRKYHRHLERELDTRLRAFFDDEAVPLVDREGLLSLHNRLDVRVVKHFSDLQSKGGYELEQGTVELSGSFHYQLRSYDDRTLREGSLNIAEMDIRQKYRVKSPLNGGAAEDTTEEAIKLALSEVVEQILDELEDELEADELRELLNG